MEGIADWIIRHNIVLNIDLDNIKYRYFNRHQQNIIH